MNKLVGAVEELKQQWEKTDWETFAYQTVIACHNESDGIEAVAHHLHSYEDELQPKLSRLNFDLGVLRGRNAALHDALYDRPLPANDAAMLTHRKRVRITLWLCLITAGACLVGNLTTFVLLGWGPLVALLAGFFITALPVGLGHPAYERFVAGNRWVQGAVIVLIAALGSAAFYELGQARRAVLDKATGQSATRSYVDDGAASDQTGPVKAPEDTETKVHGTLGGAAFLITMAAELALGYLVGLLVKLRTDQDHAAWTELKANLEEIAILEEKVAELLSRFKRAKRQCMAGIRRAQSARKKRRIPYHKALTLLIFLVLISIPRSYAQSARREEEILIDTSKSISTELFRQYLLATKDLLSAEPPNSRVWVSRIGVDSFGAHELVAGWTPDVHGVFTDELDQSRHQLATSFDMKSSAMAATAQKTDIIGGLWHAKAMFESVPVQTSEAPIRIINIFSDMKNETREFSMPELLAGGPGRMLERAKEKGLVVPLPHYKIYVCGAATAGLTPQSWTTIKRFWELYFSAAGAELMRYSPDCDVQRETNELAGPRRFLISSEQRGPLAIFFP